MTTALARTERRTQMDSFQRRSRRSITLTLKSTPIVADVSSGPRKSSSVKRSRSDDLPTEDAPGGGGGSGSAFSLEQSSQCVSESQRKQEDGGGRVVRGWPQRRTTNSGVRACVDQLAPSHALGPSKQPE